MRDDAVLRRALPLGRGLGRAALRPPLCHSVMLLFLVLIVALISTSGLQLCTSVLFTETFTRIKL